MKILAVDYGKKRTGLAETDDLKMIASPLTTVPTKDIWLFLEKYLDENQVDTLVVGEPLTEEGDWNPVEKDIRVFLNKFRKKYPGIKIEREDERYTSKMAFQSMIDGGLPKKKRRGKEVIDKVSAALILQSYLNGKQ